VQKLVEEELKKTKAGRVEDLTALVGSAFEKD